MPGLGVSGRRRSRRAAYGLGDMRRSSLVTLAAALPLAAGQAAVPPALAEGTAAAARGPVIKSIEISPSDPVVGPKDSVAIVVDVVVRGATEVSAELEPGRPDGEPGGAQARPPAAGAPDADEAATGQEAGDAPVPVPVQQVTTAFDRIAPLFAWRSGAVPSWRARGLRTAAADAGWETWRFLPEKRLSRRYPSGPWTVTVTARNARGAETTAQAEFRLRRATELSGVTVARAGGRVRVTGTLLRVDPAGRVAYRPFAGQRVLIRHRPKGARSWRTAGSATTGKDGWFSAKVPREGVQEWRVEYPGDDHHARSVSGTKQL
ncbi:hypothetical protein TBS_09630 [Thermobispora bispora]